MKSHLPFDLRLPRNWWSLLENLRMGHQLGIWWSGSKDSFSQFGWAKRCRISKAFFCWKNEFFENQASSKDSFLLFLNMTIWQASRPTVIDSGIQRKSFWNRRFKFFDFGRGRGPHKGFRCCLVVAISFFFFLLCPRVFESFLISALDRLFGFSP